MRKNLSKGDISLSPDLCLNNSKSVSKLSIQLVYVNILPYIISMPTVNLL